jgi:hypothetical protein
VRFASPQGDHSMAVKSAIQQEREITGRRRPSCACSCRVAKLLRFAGAEIDASPADIEDDGELTRWPFAGVDLPGSSAKHY